MSQSAITAAGQTFYSGLLLANFFEIPARYPGCVNTVVGGCTVSDCSAAADAGTPPDGGQVGAGTLTFTGLADAGAVVITQAANGSYLRQIQSQLFVAGSALQVSSSGGAVPAFTASVTAPVSATLTTPACPLSNCGMISKATGLPVAWTGGGTGSISVQVLTAASQVSCVFPAASGSATVPSAALAGIPPGSASLFFGSIASTTVQAGPFPIAVSASETGVFQVTIAP